LISANNCERWEKRRFDVAIRLGSLAKSYQKADTVFSMNRYDRRVRTLAVGLAALAGFVDAIGFIKLGGFFVSFMSGNSTRLGVGLAQGTSQAAIAASLIATFVMGVILGSVAGARAGGRRRPTVLVLVGALLAVAACLNMVGLERGAIAAIALAMGAENTIFEENGEARIGLTYMTGTLVKLGQRLAEMLSGGNKTAWIPYLALWMGLVTGAMAGATVYPSLGLNALWLASIAAMIFAVIASRLEQMQH
jgi:uncharacterized membrane protein YoaK (UPF0700 family)